MNWNVLMGPEIFIHGSNLALWVRLRWSYTCKLGGGWFIWTIPNPIHVVVVVFERRREGSTRRGEELRWDEILKKVSNSNRIKVNYKRLTHAVGDLDRWLGVSPLSHAHNVSDRPSSSNFCFFPSPSLLPSLLCNFNPNPRPRKQVSIQTQLFDWLG